MFTAWSYPFFIIPVRYDAFMLALHSGEWIIISRGPRLMSGCRLHDEGFHAILYHPCQIRCFHVGTPFR